MCDLTPRGGRKLIQTKLNVRKTPIRRQDDTGRAVSLILSSPDRETIIQKKIDVQTPSVGTEDALCMNNTTGLELKMKQDTE